jgi:uncharacterized protein (TIGR01244 family)
VKLAALALFIALVAACRAVPREPAPPWPVFETAELGAMTNVHRVGDLWVGASPTPEDLELASRRGIRLAIDVRPAWLTAPHDLESAARANGIDFARVPFDAQSPDAAQVERVLAELRRPGPALLFCHDGGGAAVLFAVRRVLHDGVPLEEALSEARHLGMKPGVAEEFVRTLERRARGAT